MTADLIAFLTACLDDEERKAKAAAQLAQTAHWDASPEGMVLNATVTDHYHRLATGENGKSLDDIGAHIAHWDPARVLADIDAKRRIVASADHHARRAREDQEAGRPSRAVETVRDTLHTVLMDLALPAAGRPGYDERWRP